MPAALDFDLQSAMQDESGRDADNNSGGNLPQRAREDAREQSARSGAERRPDTDLAAPPGDRERNERVQPGRRQRQHTQCHDGQGIGRQWVDIWVSP